MSVEAVLDAADVSWPAQHWLSFNCPSCQEPSHVEVSESRVSLGEIDGAPGPCFIPSSSVGVQEFSIRSSGIGISIRYAKKLWFVKARK